MEPTNTELPQNPITPVGEVMQPLLLMASSSGDCEVLKILLSWGDSPVRPATVAPQVVVDVPDGDTFDVNDVPNGSLAVQPTSTDAVEEGPDQPNDASNGSLASQEVTDQPAGNATDGILTLQQASTTDAGTDQLGNNTDGRSDMQQTPSEAVQQGVDQPAVPPSESILGGTTPQGDTALHVVAKSGSSGDNFLDSVYVIYNKAKHLMDATNKMGDTPLHCAARTGNCGMVSYLVDLAKCEADGSDKLKTLLRKQNKRGETVLHEAIRSENGDIVNLLLTEDSELARVPSVGTSPLYLAILLREFSTAEKLYEGDNQLSYSGPDGQNALHAAAIRNIAMTKILLDWNKELIIQPDHKGSTPLHYAVSWRGIVRGISAVLPLLEANPSAAYQPDKSGSFPIHIAASNGSFEPVVSLLKKCPECVNLCDTQGRTFFHVAVEKKHYNIVSYACRAPLVASILNTQDNDGNTPLHLAVLTGNLRIFCSLMGNRQVRLNLPNYSGLTPLALSWCMLPRGLSFHWNPQALILLSLRHAGAGHGCYQQGFLNEHRRPQLVDDKEQEKIKDSTQVLGIGSALIATVAFGATFALPGGYRADDHPNGGTPTLAGRYTFDAFVMANTLAFVCASVATIGLMFSGMAMVDLSVRGKHFNMSVFFASSSVTSLVTAFALGLYMVLAPVAHNTAVAVIVITLLVMLIGIIEPLPKLEVARALRARLGIRICRIIIHLIFELMFWALWPFIIIFGWAAISTRCRHN